MDVNEVKEKRKQLIIIEIIKEIDSQIINRGLNKTQINCPDDLFAEIKKYFTDEGFNIWREGYRLLDTNGCETMEMGYNYYIGL